MPLLVRHDFVQNQQHLLVWHLSETTEELIGHFSDRGKVEVQLEKMPLEKRRREWMSSRILLANILPEASISALPNGKPIISGGDFISISHCGDFAGLVVSTKSVGLDIQDPNPTILKIYRKFSNEPEQQAAFSSANPLTYFTMLWSIKEAVFKFFGERVTFSDDIHVKTFNITDQLIHVAYSGEHGVYDFEITHLKHEVFHILFTSGYVQRKETEKRLI